MPVGPPDRGTLGITMRSSCRILARIVIVGRHSHGELGQQSVVQLIDAAGRPQSPSATMTVPPSCQIPCVVDLDRPKIATATTSRRGAAFQGPKALLTRALRPPHRPARSGPEARRMTRPPCLQQRGKMWLGHV